MARPRIREKLLAEFDTCSALARALLGRATDEELAVNLRLHDQPVPAPSADTMGS